MTRGYFFGHKCSNLNVIGDFFGHICSRFGVTLDRKVQKLGTQRSIYIFYTYPGRFPSQFFEWVNTFFYGVTSFQVKTVFSEDTHALHSVSTSEGTTGDMRRSVTWRQEGTPPSKCREIRTYFCRISRQTSHTKKFPRHFVIFRLRVIEAVTHQREWWHKCPAMYQKNLGGRIRIILIRNRNNC